MQLSQSRLKEITQRYMNKNVEAIILVGSYARNTAKPESDIDITIYQNDLKNSVEIQREQFEGCQLSISRTTIEDHASLSNPTKAVWSVDYLRTAKPLYDPNGSFATLQNKAHTFEWKSIQVAANVAASHKLEKYTEEVIKIVGGLKEKDDFTTLNALSWLYMGLPMVIALQKGIFLINESSFFKQILTALGEESNWSRYFLFVTGIKTFSSPYTPIQTRGIAGLYLYKETESIIKKFITPEDQTNIDEALKLIDEQLEETNIHFISKITL